MSLKYDVDGDGRNDALYITENGTLAAKAIDTDLTISNDAFWETPLREPYLNSKYCRSMQMSGLTLYCDMVGQPALVARP